MSYYLAQSADRHGIKALPRCQLGHYTVDERPFALSAPGQRGIGGAAGEQALIDDPGKRGDTRPCQVTLEPLDLMDRRRLG